jgi:dihydroorotase
LRVDLVIEGKAYLDGRLIEAAVVIDDGVIASISSPALAPSSDERVVMRQGQIMLPGMVDMHVHLRDFSQAYKEDWYTGTLAALRGGVTLVADMPNNDPFIDSLERLMEKLEIAARKALVDFTLYCGVPRDLREIPEIRRIACGFKIYPEDYGKLLSIINHLEGDLVVVHPEDLETIMRERRLIAKPTIEDHGRIRPRIAEIRAVENMLRIAGSGRIRLHLTHLTTSDSIMMIASSKLHGATISCDATLHHALLSSDAMRRFGGIAKVNPPLRSREDADAVLNAIRLGLVDAIVSDHAPHLLEEKLRSSYDEVPPGFPGLEIYLPLIMTQIMDGVMPLKTLDLYSRRPAEILGARKGALEPGMDGDVVVVELGREHVIDPSRFASKAKYSPFEGWVVRAEVRMVFLRGVLALEDGEPRIGMGFGRHVARS